MTVHVRKYGPAKQVHEAGDKGVCHTKAVIDEHGYTLKITVEMNYNKLTNRRIPFAHKAMHDVITSALDTADSLRGSNPAMWDTDDLLDLQPAPTIDMDPEHA